TLVLAGHRQPLAVHLLAHAVNAALGNVGRTILLHEAPETKEGTLADLAKALQAGQAGTLIVLGGNPVYNAPADLDWAKTQRKAKTVVRLGYYEDETFAVSDWHLPMAHYLESWGDARTADGTVVSVQPLIAPLFGGLTELEVLARMGGLEKTAPYDIVRETFKGLAGESEEAWKKFLHDGFLAASAFPPVQAQFDGAALARALSALSRPAPPSKDKLEVVFHRDYSLDDGRYNNNGWLQELPDPISKITWENLILLSPQTAKEFGLEIEDEEKLKVMAPWVKVQLDGQEIDGPAWIQPGLADFTLGLALGYGRRQTGRIGRDSGYDAYRLRMASAPHLAAGAKLVPTNKTHQVASTQNHWAMEGRPIIREANLEQYRQRADFAKSMNLPEPPGPRDAAGRPRPIYPNPLDTLKEKGLHQWGMSIDLNSCVGCSACMMACQSENNIPIVGKPQVGRNREMHWLRIDRYYSGSVADPQVVNQPMLCQHCESAPCESVCPVNATVHDEEGLNVMVYNRCVGTRYCSNNCPYKVRRFNYFDYNRRPLDQLKGPVYPSPLLHATGGEWDLIRWFKDVDRGHKPADEWELLKLVKNPDVTVRMRGIMEKCTFCIQRIEQAKIARKVKAGASGEIEVPDGTIQTACQQACPAEAIVFGNVADPHSRVSKLKEQERNYTVLEFLATKPRLTYLARVRNPNPLMPDFHELPLSIQEYEKKNGNPFEPYAGHGKPAPGASHPEAGKGGH
ncbi:MAG: 4Fe-4S dicluster domain-containing protein, partial [Chloroflexi bacterium]|nr:4Fe-4S dicluster domain-containing protein [Chloroflexota bacterium]